MSKILVVDDEANVQRLLQYTLKQAGYTVAVAGDGQEALKLWQSEQPALILLDVGLPKLDGYAVAERIRAEEGDKSHVPIIMLTSEKEVEQKVRGLRAGADDYLVKPFVTAELELRLRALLRRRPPATGVLRVGDLVVDADTRTARRSGIELELTRREFDLLEVLTRNAGVVLTRDRLLELVWGYDFDVGTNAVDTFVSYLRRKLESGGAPRLIHTVRGVGFLLRRPT
jgi:DNA-binding response OmpR family regulator